MNWKKINISNDLVTKLEPVNIMNILFSSSETTTSMTDAALFSSYNSINGTEIIYITPSAVNALGDKLSKYSPEKCDKPNKEEIGFLAGDCNAWRLFD